MIVVCLTNSNIFSKKCVNVAVKKKSFLKKRGSRFQKSVAVHYIKLLNIYWQS